MRPDHQPRDFTDESLNRELDEVMWQWGDVLETTQQAVVYWRVRGEITPLQAQWVQAQLRATDLLIRAMRVLASRLFRAPGSPDRL